MDLNLLKNFAERLQLETIGDPEWIESKRVFEYQNQSVEVITVLKLVRATQAIHALDILCRNGFFIDLGVIYRCIEDCTAEVYFLLENYPKQSPHVTQFIKEFFSKTIDGHLSSNERHVETKKIHTAMVRSLTGSEQDEHIRKSLTNVYKTFSGYTHAGYAHIMQMYGGPLSSPNFNIAGIPSPEQKDLHMQLVIEAYNSVLYTIAHVARTFNLKELYHDIIQYC